MITTRLFWLATAVLALHVVDDNFLQPQPGMGAGDHLLSGLVPLTILAGAAWAFPRLGGFAQGAVALLLGPLGVAAGLEALYYTREVGASGDDFTGLLCVPAGLLLVGLGAATLWRTRRVDGSRARRWLRRSLLAAAGALVAVTVLLPIGQAYVQTHVQRAVVPANELGVPSEEVRFTTSDGLELEGWYLPSKNGAAIIAFPGRKGPQDRARMLARHGYGVLLFDRRGEGASDGEPHGYGWGGTRDVEAAIAFLRGRPEVDPDRIGGIGLSVGGELLLETAAGTDALSAVVSEGAGARMLTENLDADMGGLEWALAAPAFVVKDAALAVFSNQAPPTDLKDLVGRIAPRPVLLIAAPGSRNGELRNRDYAKKAGLTASLWEIPESRHTGGLDAQPEAYEQRVIAFFDEALGPRPTPAARAGAPSDQT